jgi:hypothetical protein
VNYIDQDDELDNESGLHEPDEFDILQELYTQERVANDFLIERLKTLATAEPDEALQGIRDILQNGYLYFDEPRSWDRPSVTSLLPTQQQLDLF